MEKLQPFTTDRTELLTGKLHLPIKNQLQQQEDATELCCQAIQKALDEIFYNLKLSEK